MTTETRFEELAAHIWSTADMLLRPGGIEQENYGRVILPFTVLRRLDCVLEPTRKAVWEQDEKLTREKVAKPEKALQKAAGDAFYNTSRYDFRALINDPQNCAQNVTAWLAGFSPGVKEILERFGFDEVRKTVEDKKILYKLLQHFAKLDLHPSVVPNEAMGSVFEELVRRWSDNIDQNAGQYFTPREVVDLMAGLVLLPDQMRLSQDGVVATIYDPCCGTGGMLFGAKRRIQQLNRNASVYLFGQETAGRIWSVCRADLLIAGRRDGADVGTIGFGSTLSDDQFPDKRFDYLLSNPPYGYHWEEADGAKVRAEFKQGGGRFMGGLPRKTDGQMLFLQHMIAKMQSPEDGGARMAIVMGGSPLFAGDAGSGESEIRRWIFEHDLCEAIIALPEQLFFNTGIGTYVWILTNRKQTHRDKVLLIDATDLWIPMKKSLGYKRRELSPTNIEEIQRIYRERADGPRSRLLDSLEFGFRRLRVERPLRLRLSVTEEGLARLGLDAAWQKFVEKDAAGASRLLRALDGMRGESFTARARFRVALESAASAAGVTVTVPVRKAIEGALGERDEDAEICCDERGRPEPDTSLRSQNEETAPLTETLLDEWFKRHVTPHVPDAWLDSSVRERTYKYRDADNDKKNPERPGSVGYEVNFNRYFFKYTPPRSLADIDRELVAAEAALQAALHTVMGR